LPDQGPIENKQREITIETLSTPPLDIRPAPLDHRLMACIIDSALVLSIWLGILGLILRNPLGWSFDLPRLAYLFVFGFVYYSVTEWLLAASVGKLFMKLRVLGTDGDPCSLTASLVRNAMRLIDWLPLFYLLGGVLILASAKKRRAGDMVANTIVTLAPVRDKNPPPAPFLYH
jgi:uncharacterized RDD family membrane protein YckC